MEKVIFISVPEQELRLLFGDVMDEKLKSFIQHDKTKSPSFVTRKETARLLRISLPTLHEYTKNGILVGYRIGGRILYKLSEIEDVLEENSTAKYRSPGK